MALLNDLMQHGEVHELQWYNDGLSEEKMLSQ